MEYLGLELLEFFFPLLPVLFDFFLGFGLGVLYSLRSV